MVSVHNCCTYAWYSTLHTTQQQMNCTVLNNLTHTIHHTLVQEVTGREDSESYAKRTITEIETCLGFTFHGADAAEEAPAESISTNELEASRIAGNAKHWVYLLVVMQ